MELIVGIIMATSSLLWAIRASRHAAAPSARASFASLGPRTNF
jgi:hypothetical protein